MYRAQTSQLALSPLITMQKTDATVIRDESCHFFQSVNGWSLHFCYLVHSQTAEGVAVLHPYLPVINLHDILQKCIIERKLVNKKV